jgi:SSS family solute:Na+ symporter
MQRSFGVLPITLTLIATQLGGGMLLGSAQEAYTNGLYGIFYALSIIFGFLLLGSGIAGRLQALKVTTTAQLFESVYNAPHLKKIASLLSVLTLSGLFISQMVGSRALLCSLQITNVTIFIFFWLAIIISAMIGGLKSIIWTNFIQISYIFFIFSGIFIYCLTQEQFPLSCLPCLESLQESLQSLDTTSAAFATTLMMPALYCLIEQDVAQRFFAARTKKVAVMAAIFASILFFFFALIPVYFGIKARVLNLPLQADASPLLPAITYLTNEIFAALAACGVLIAITSTANSLLCAIGSNIMQDFGPTHIKADKMLFVSKIITLTVGTSCLIVSFYMPTSLISIIINSYAISVVCLLVPLLFAYYNHTLPKTAAVYAILGGGIAYIGANIFFSTLPKEGVALLFSLAGFLIGRYTTIGSRT